MDFILSKHAQDCSLSDPVSLVDSWCPVCLLWGLMAGGRVWGGHRAVMAMHIALDPFLWAKELADLNYIGKRRKTGNSQLCVRRCMHILLFKKQIIA